MIEKEKIRFKCRACGEYVDMNRNVLSGFVDWAYTGFDWLAPGESLPPLSCDIYDRREKIPEKGELCFVKVRQPFEEMIGNTVNFDFLPPMIFFNGFEESPDEADETAVVRCRIEDVLERDDYSAWIKVFVCDVTRYNELPGKYSPAFIDKTLEEFSIYHASDCVEYDSERWKTVYWTAQGDIGESKVIFIDDSHVRHLVTMNFFTSHEDIMYFGNIVEALAP